MYAQRLLKYETFICTACHKYYYDERNGDAKQDILPCTLIDDLPKDWECPVCGAAKNNLYPVLCLGWPRDSQCLPKEYCRSQK